jgi:hypothetical protein
MHLFISTNSNVLQHLNWLTALRRECVERDLVEAFRADEVLRADDAYVVLADGK